MSAMWGGLSEEPVLPAAARSAAAGRKPGGRFVCGALAGRKKWHILAGSADDAATQIRSTSPKAKAEGKSIKKVEKTSLEVDAW